MHTYNVSASYKGANLPVKFSGQKVNEYFAFSIVCNPTVKTPCGWHPLLSAPGYCLPGEVLPPCTVTVVNNAGVPLTDFLQHHTITAHLVSTSLKNRLSLQPIVPVALNVTPSAGNSFTLNGVLPPNVCWLKLRIVVDGVCGYDLPLWPVGVPVTIIRGLPNFGASNFSSKPLNRNTTDFVPYLAPSLSEQTFNPLYAPDLQMLLSGIDPESFFTKPHDRRQAYNAIELKQGSIIHAALLPSINLKSGKLLFSSAPGPQKKFLSGYLDPHLKFISAGPIMLAEQGVVKPINSTYNASLKAWETDFAVNVSSQGFFQNKSFSNYTLSGEVLDVATFTTNLTLVSSDPKSQISLGNILAPRDGDLAVVAFDPTLSRNAKYLSFWTNPTGLFFFQPKTLSGQGVLSTSASLKTFTTNSFILPEWTSSAPSIPLYLVTFEGGSWKPFTELYGVPIQVSTTPVAIKNTAVSGSTLMLPNVVPQKSFSPLTPSGSLIFED